jgi:hypothetical protein
MFSHIDYQWSLNKKSNIDWQVCRDGITNLAFMLSVREKNPYYKGLHNHPLDLGSMSVKTNTIDIS